MSLGTFIAGRYSGTFNTSDVGICKEGYELELDTEIDEIAETDAWGGTVIDGIWRGGNCFLQFTSEEYKTGSLAAFWPYGGGVAGPGVLGTLVNTGAISPIVIGQLASAIAKALVLTAVTGTPAQTTPAIATLTASLALLAKNYAAKLLLNSKLREVPVRLRLYPSTTSSVTSFFVTT